ncbi:MAG: transcription-repair coupling factor, partial [Actinomycetes bacterium]
LPARGVLYGADVAPAPHVIGERQQALAALAAGGVVVAEAVALLERFLPLELQPRPLALEPGRELSFDGAVAQLATLGYERVEQVRGRGEYAVRGGLIDAYPAIGDPLRVEFWGDEVESLRTFSIYSQRTTGTLEGVVVYAAFEADTSLPEYESGVHQAIAAWEREGREEAPDALFRRAGVRALATLAGRFVTLADVIAGAGLGCAVFSADETYRALAEFDAEVAMAVGGAEARERLYVPLAEVRALLSGSLQIDVVQRDQPVQFNASRPQFAARDISGAERDLMRLVNDGYRVFVVFRHAGEAERATYRLRNLSAEVVSPEQLARGGEAAAGLYFLAAPLRDGFVSADLKLAVVNERALLRAAPREQRFAGGTRLASFFDVRPDDYVVHEDHGIARFAGIETRTVGGITRDYLLLQFKGEDRVFVPHDQIGKVSRYIGASGASPTLDKLGGTHWQTVKTRARTAVVEMAGELLQLYAARQAVPGFAFPPDGELMLQLEEAFPFEETEDQAEAIDEVKNDMEAPHPMDRLVCGDVGYGKTEVALRAAFKAAEAGRQTLVLVPTTILAEQHLMTFSERFADLPVKIGMVSRFRTAAEQRRILAEFSAGKIDVLIGTHRLLSTDVQPHDLGLVVVDEEQRFGVRQKELLRNLKLQVDVISLSATPIPRTLQMSLTGIRDISVIETAPQGRHEIRTYIGEYRDDLVRIAIEKELARGGQAFYLHNRVESIDQAAEHVRELAPQGARILVAHGQMHERALEKVMLAFLSGEADILVTTSIIESGIDIPTANTLIVERADMLGLAQLYQIRGRIGRSDEHAFAYLLYPSEELLTSDAAARLTTLSDHTDLGAGFKIAMADLEIRGAGNLLGDEQSGHVAAVGFEMYAQMLEEAVHELQGEQAALLAPVRVDVPVTAYVPPDYIAYEASKIDAHRRIARVRSLRELGDVRAELADRFGAPPEPVENLFTLQAIKLKAAELPATAVTVRGGRLQLDGLDLDDDWAARLRAANQRVVYMKQKRSLSVHREASGEGVLGWVEAALDAILTARVSHDRSSTPGRDSL